LLTEQNSCRNYKKIVTIDFIIGINDVTAKK